ncbi:MAG: hypothetical protein IT215_07005 [Chitinophagaceae bacterium]|nr:hypothetical protein [Chitinophagaceae bacterium]
MQYQYSVSERFIRYVQIDTQSDPNSSSFPSSEKQKNLALILKDELVNIGLKDVELDEYGYVYANIESNTDKQVPVI